MADFSFPSLTTAVVGIASTQNYLVQSTSSYTQSVSNGTRSLGNITNSSVSVVSDTTTAIPPKRPQTGQVYPRGVYNK